MGRINTRNISLFILLTMLMTILAAAALSSGASGQVPTDLFMSEYVEGTSFNKAIEIYNATGANVDLGAEQYIIQTYFNGSTSLGLTINLAGTVVDGDVFVVAHASAAPEVLA
jgi:predicted extracellular nuclease